MLLKQTIVAAFVVGIVVGIVAGIVAAVTPFATQRNYCCCCPYFLLDWCYSVF